MNKIEVFHTLKIELGLWSDLIDSTDVEGKNVNTTAIIGNRPTSDFCKKVENYYYAHMDSLLKLSFKGFSIHNPMLMMH